jgi:hypothetical protein
LPSNFSAHKQPYQSLEKNSCLAISHLNMAPTAVSTLEQEDHARDAAFNKILHGTSAEKRGGMMAMLGKDAGSQKAAVDEYFKHWDNKAADVETEEVRKARRDEYATLTRQYASQLGSLDNMLIASQLLQPCNRLL